MCVVADGVRLGGPGRVRVLGAEVLGAVDCAHAQELARHKHPRHHEGPRQPGPPSTLLFLVLSAHELPDPSRPARPRQLRARD
eukprot:2929514-Rhodomonas_salina.1